MPSKAIVELTDRRRTRSVGFLVHEGCRWSCYLVTYRTGARTWRGHLTFRTTRAQSVRSVRTAPIFLEQEEDAIDRKARQLGRPLLSALLSSALQVETTAEEVAGTGPGSDQEMRSGVRSWVEGALRDRASRGPAPVQDRSAGRARYETYRIDQLTHLVTLMDAASLEDLVMEVLDGERFEFGARDRLQFALLVVQRLEALLPLPPLQVFLEDLAAHPAEHERYRHQLYQGDPLP